MAAYIINTVRSNTMIYTLDNAFIKIKETEGLLENKSIHTPVEIVMTDGLPEEETSFELQPKEKIPFCVPSGQCIYARVSNYDHSSANLAVVNFHLHASENIGINEKILWAGSAGTKGDTSFTSTIVLNESLANYRKLGIKASFYIDDDQVRPQYKEFLTSQLIQIIENKGLDTLSCLYREPEVTGFADIQATSTLDKLVLVSRKSFVEEIIGIS